jgi:GTPase SAR1 family protein
MQTVPHSHEDRQWDIRVNVQNDDYLQEIIENVMLENVAGKFRYLLIGGLEIGTRPNHSDYQVRHFHAAVIFHNRASKASIIKNWGIKEGNGYYMVPRNRELPYTGWREHHIKEFSKIDPKADDGLIILEYGELPKDNRKRSAIVLRSEQEKKMKTDDIIKDMRKLIEEGKADDAFNLYPRNYMQYGEKLKSMIHQKKKQFFGKHTDPHLYVYGYPSSGKTSMLQMIYAGYYKKDLSNRFWDLYDEEVHSHVMLEDLDSNNLERLGVQFMKTICDEAGFPIDQKYKTPQLTRATILVTSNQDLSSLINGVDDVKDVESVKAALFRRFLHMRADQLQRVLGIKLIPEYERKMLKKEGNEDPSKLYISWNYNLDAPTGLPLKKPEEYRQMIRDYYYK